MASAQAFPDYCGICGSEDDRNAENTMIKTSCQHSYHYQCLLSWFQENQTNVPTPNRECPYCRSSYRPIPLPEGMDPSKMVPGFNLSPDYKPENDAYLEDGYDVEFNNVPTLTTTDKCMWTPSVMLTTIPLNHPGKCFKNGIPSLSHMCVAHYRKAVMNTYRYQIDWGTRFKLVDFRAKYRRCVAKNPNGKMCRNHPIFAAGKKCLCKKHYISETPGMTHEKLPQMDYVVTCEHVNCNKRPVLESEDLYLCKMHLRKHIQIDIEEQHSFWLREQLDKINQYYLNAKKPLCKAVDCDGNPCSKKGLTHFSGYCSNKHMTNPSSVISVATAKAKASASTSKPLCGVFNAFTGHYCMNVAFGNKSYCLIHLSKIKAEEYAEDEANLYPDPYEGMGLFN